MKVSYNKCCQKWLYWMPAVTGNYIYQHRKSGGRRLFFSLPTIKTSHREEFWARGGVWEPGFFFFIWPKPLEIAKTILYLYFSTYQYFVLMHQWIAVMIFFYNYIILLFLLSAFSSVTRFDVFRSFRFCFQISFMDFWNGNSYCCSNFV